jgi:hypothetical protein
MTSSHALEVERALDLKRQIAGLDAPDTEFLFKDTSPPSRWETVYSTQTGEPIRVKRHRIIPTLEKRLPDGSKAFTADALAVPTYRLGEVKCFLAKGSEQRDLVDELNIAPGYYCIAEHLANDMAATVHAERRHPTRWRMFKEHKEKVERDRDRDERREQTAAILALASANAPKTRGSG